MKNTTKKVARMLASLLARHGVNEAVVSPGSRNAPLIVALERHPGINTHVVIDERSAGFIALGMSNVRGNMPVSLVCTSGTAPLNYAPAIAEAFYRHSPLIVITADRPAEWIGQDDSQTINQVGIFNNFIKASFDIPVESDEPDRMWMINRTLNDAILAATYGCPGPVHINVRLADPLGETAEFDETDEFGCKTRHISMAKCAPCQIDDGYLAMQCQKLAAPAKVLILAGFMVPCGIDAPLSQLANRPNVVVMHEAQSNIHGKGYLSNIDAALRFVGNGLDESYSPDIVITIGGSLTSRMVKEWLRKLPDLEHWSIGPSDNSVDCFRKLSLRIPCNPREALNAIASHIPQQQCSEITEFKQLWNLAVQSSVHEAEMWADESPWCDFKAVNMVMKAMPDGCNLQLSNGTSVRYVQLFNYSKASRIDCNRGVSGIDGCTSTAIGAALASGQPTVLITGDMSMQYDLGALACTFIPKNFKIIVLNNGGGGIFRFIRTTGQLEELEHNFVADVRLPLAQVAPAYGFLYYSATDETELNKALPEFFGIDSAPSILEIVTDGATSAKRLKQFFETKL